MKLRLLLSPRFLFFYMVLSLAVPNVALCFTENTPLMADVVGVLLPILVYALVMSLDRCIGRMVWVLFLLVFFAAFQMVLVYLYGNGVIAVDMFLNLVTTNPGEAMELLDNLVPAVAGVFILYLPLLAIAAWQWAKGVRIDSEFQRLAIRRALCLILPLALLLVGCYVAYPKGNEKKGKFEYHVEDNLYPVNVFYNLCLAVHESSLSAHYNDNVADFRFNAVSEHAKDSAEVYVLVVGETARSRDFQLYGYNRPTNPLLSTTDGLLVFRNVRSQSNTTHKSVPMLLTAATADDHDRLHHEKGILAAFREAGFYTVFLSNQQPNHSYIDFLGSQADEHLFIREADAKADEAEGASASGNDVVAQTSDERLLPFFNKAMAKGHKKLFVVLHMYGSHFNYRDRYPQSRARFMPDTPTEAKPENRPQLVNAYDNTILQTDYILHSIIEKLRSTGAVSAMMYTSDHGENIFDDSRRLFLHASPRPSEYDTDVPLLVWTSESYAREYAPVVDAMKSNLNKGVQTSASVFPTMLSIGGISTKARVDSLSLTNRSYHMGTRLYLNDHNHAVPLAMYGIK
ncbi:phosphoethanolamine transferase [uncultured Prevotella sp.]|uniref:phosphoethanolamine transferase n=1 Tax=uncultured Prevotella sp. TaxID=159272 RepID=UPI0025F7E202|nr:phosphoethanolamine transferase [uncultured Prevotella sp.]